MPNDYLNQVKLNGTVYDIKDTTSGYTTNTGTVTGITAGTGLSGGTINSSGTISLDTTRAVSTSDIDTGTDTTNKLVSAKTISDAIDNAISGIPTVDEKVKQTSINTNSNYPILLKKSANATEETNTVNATNLTSGTAISINPSTGDLNVVKINGQTVGSSPKFTDTNTTYTLSGALSSHKFTSTLTAGGSGSGTSTSDITLAAGSNITLADDTSNRKITISATVPTVPVTDVQVDSTSILSGGVADLKTSASHPYSSTNALATMGDIAAAGGGTVTDITIKTTSPISGGSDTAATSSGTWTISHATSGVTAKTGTPAIYPFTVNDTGHITSVGTAVTIPTVNDGNLKLKKDSGTASTIFSANKSGDTTLTYTTKSVGSASNWSAGTMTSIDTTKFSGGSFTGGTFTPASMTSSLGSQSATATNPTTLTISFSGGSHASDSFTAASLSSGFYSAGTAPSLTVSSETVVSGLSAA